MSGKVYQTKAQAVCMQAMLKVFSSNVDEKDNGGLTVNHLLPQRITCIYLVRCFSYLDKYQN